MLNKSLSRLTQSALILSIAMLTSCVMEQFQEEPQEELHEVVFHAGWDGETKTVLQEDGSVYWSPGDEISLFDEAVGYGHYKLTATNTEPAASTDFVGKIGDNAGNPKYVAVYPYNSDNAIDKDGFHTTFPVVQTAKEGTFDKNLFVSVAISDNNNLYFRNICSGIKFSVKTPGIKKVVVKSYDSFIAGYVHNYEFSSGNILSNNGSSTSVTVMAPSESGFVPGQYYYAVFLAHTSSSGVEISYYTEDLVATYEYHQPIEFKSGVFKRLLNKDEDLNFRKAYSSYALLDKDNILPEGVDKTVITEAYFHVSTDKQTNEKLNSYGSSDIYFEMKGTEAHYYTSAESFKPSAGRLFASWKSLKHLDLSCFDTYDVISFKEMFAGCLMLESIDLSSFVTTKAEDMSLMFASCSSLKSLDLSNFDTGNVKDMGLMFGRSWEGLNENSYHYCVYKGCSSLMSLDLHTFDTHNVENMASMFFGCSSLEKINISGWDTKNVTSIGSMFANCSKLKNVDLSSFDTSNIESMDYLFENCVSLESIDLPKFNTAKEISIHSMFKLCKSLKCVDLSSLSPLTIETCQDLFSQCYKLMKVDLGQLDLSSTTGLYGAFYSGPAMNHQKCAIRCISSTRDAIINAGSWLTRDYVWAKPEEDFPEIEAYINPDLYYSTDYSMDMKFKLLNRATKGKGIPVAIIGDAYSDRLISDGTYEKDMKEVMDIIFSVEPYKSFKDLFNIYMIYAVSENEVATGNTALGSYRMVGNSEIINSYVLSAIKERYITEISTVVVSHDQDCLQNSGAGGLTWHAFQVNNPDVYPTVDYGQFQQSIALIPKYSDSDGHNFPWIVKHEFGHCFATLADEYVEYEEPISDAEKEFMYVTCRGVGIYRNIDITSDPEEIKWSKFLKDPRYAETGIGIYEGGDLYGYGVWRPSMGSIMNNGVKVKDSYNAPSREAIYNRIHKLAYGADWQFDYDAFVQWDAPNIEIDVQNNASLTNNIKSVGKTNNKKPYFSFEESKQPDGSSMIYITME